MSGRDRYQEALRVGLSKAGAGKVRRRAQMALITEREAVEAAEIAIRRHSVELVQATLEAIAKLAEVGPVYTPIGTFRWKTRARRRIRNFEGLAIELPPMRQLSFTAAVRFRAHRVKS